MRLLRLPPTASSASATASSAAPLPWISPLQYPKPTPPPPSPPPLSPRPPRFISHADAIRLISRSQDPQRALDIFNSAASQPGFSHNHATYSSILLRLARARKFTAVDALLLQVQSEPAQFHESLLLNLIPLYLRASLPEKALSAFLSILPLTRRRPSPKALASTLHQLLSASHTDLAFRLLNISTTRIGLRPTACIYNILIKHHCKTNNLEAAFSVLDEMRLGKTEPNVITYSTIMGGLCRDGRMKDAFQLLEEMIERDRIAPDHLTYNVLISGFCRGGDPDKGSTILAFMRGNGCDPNLVNYSTLMHGFYKAGRVDDVRSVFEEMRRCRLEPDLMCYTTLIAAVCRAGDVDEGIALMKEMRCEADTGVYNVVIEGLCRGGRVTEAMEMLERLPYKGVRLNAASYRIAMNWLLGAGEVGRAVGLLGLMLGRGFVPHFAASNKLLIEMCEAGKVADGTVALYGLAEMGFAPESSTWARLVEAVCRERKLQKTLELLNELTLDFRALEI